MMDPWTNYWSLCRWRWRRYMRKRILELRAEIFCIKFLLCIECPLCPTMDNNCPSPKSPLHTYLKTFEYESHQLKVQYPNTSRPTSHVMYISPDKAQFYFQQMSIVPCTSSRSRELSTKVVSYPWPWFLIIHKLRENVRCPQKCPRADERLDRIAPR